MAERLSPCSSAQFRTRYHSQLLSLVQLGTMKGKVFHTSPPYIGTHHQGLKCICCWRVHLWTVVCSHFLNSQFNYLTFWWRGVFFCNFCRISSSCGQCCCLLHCYKYSLTCGLVLGALCQVLGSFSQNACAVREPDMCFPQSLHPWHKGKQQSACGYITPFGETICAWIGSAVGGGGGEAMAKLFFIGWWTLVGGAHLPFKTIFSYLRCRLTHGAAYRAMWMWLVNRGRCLRGHFEE